MPELSKDQLTWLKRILLGSFGGETASKQPRPVRGGAVSGMVSGVPAAEKAGSRPSLLGQADDHFNRNPTPQPQHSTPLTSGASDRLNGLGFASPPASALHAGPRPASNPGAKWHNAPMPTASNPGAPPKLGATPEAGPAPLPDAGQLILDGVADTVTDGSNPLPFNAGAALAMVVDDGTVAGGLGAEAAGVAVGGLLAAGTAVAKDADKVTSGKMTAADATADVVVEGATGAATALVGAEAGAAAGALLGSVVPGLGTAVGGVVGFLVGGVAGYAAGQLAHSGSALSEAKKELGGALSTMEEPLQSAWGVAAGAVHVVGGGVDALEKTAGQAADAVADAAGAAADAVGSLWDSLKATDPSVVLQAA